MFLGARCVFLPAKVACRKSSRAFLPVAQFVLQKDDTFGPFFFFCISCPSLNFASSSVLKITYSWRGKHAWVAGSHCPADVRRRMIGNAESRGRQADLVRSDEKEARRRNKLRIPEEEMMIDHGMMAFLEGGGEIIRFGYYRTTRG